MSDLTAERAASPATLHVVSYIRWEREGHETFETLRARLLDTLARLLERMSADPKLHVLLGGQTVILEDVAAVRPDLLALLVIYNAGGRLGIGPWYVQVDEALVSGESLVRNLLIGRADALRHGINLLPVAYVADGYGHVGQLPQIIRGFGIDSAFIKHGGPGLNMPFRWLGPDNSALLVVNHDDRSATPQEDARTSLEEQKTRQPNGPFLWMDVSALGVLPELVESAGVPVIQSSLPAYIKGLRQEMPDFMRTTLQGELRLQGLSERAYLLPGMLSARLHLKQANQRLENLLIHAAEPWLALALTHGTVAHPDNLRGLLDHSWRLLVKNQARNALGGCASDAVHAENEMRFQQVEDCAHEVIAGALRALPGKRYADAPDAPDATAQTTYLVAWNPHGWQVEQIVEAAVRIPPDRYPAKVIDPQGVPLDFGWEERTGGKDHTGILSFKAHVPPVGYGVYTVQLSAEQDFVYPVRSAAAVISSVPEAIVLAVKDGKLVTRVLQPPVYDDAGQVVREGSEQDLIADLLRFFDGGDAGDAYNYAPPEPDVIAQADLQADVQVESAAMYERLILRHRLRVAPSLRANRSRGRGVKLIELTTTATLYTDTPGVYFRTTFDNSVDDHRLRAHLRTGIRGDEVLADSAFGVVTRKAVVEGKPLPDKPNMEGVIGTHPMHSLCAVQDESAGMALLARGLPEFEAIPEDGQLTLALTLVRAVGWLSRGDVRTRTAALGPRLAVPGAQCQRAVAAEYALVPTWPNDPTLVRTGCEFSAPLQVYQYSQPPEEKQRSYLSVEGEGVLMTALKPPQSGKGWIVRLLNPTQQAVQARLGPQGRVRRAEQVNLAEETQRDLWIDKGQVAVSLDPNQIVTVRLGFE